MKKYHKREVELLVLSDVHLGTYGCKAKELLSYLKTVNPQTLVLNGDIIDVWQFSKHYFPKSHFRLIEYFISLLTNGTKVYYVTGNHDEMLRRFEGLQLGSLEIVNKLLLELDGKKIWIFHGDVFDMTMKHARWLAKLGGIGYDLLIMLNTMVNWISKKLGRGRISFSRRIKKRVKGAVISDFEKTATDIALYNGYDYVVCGHVHQPKIRQIKDKEGRGVMYLNSGDWVENLTALEYEEGKWSIYSYFNDPKMQNAAADISKEDNLSKVDYKHKQLFNELLQEFQFSQLNANGSKK